MCQPCLSCSPALTPLVPCSVAFAVLAAAQTAAAVALRQSFVNATLSEQDFFMCRTADQYQERSCSAGWSLREGMLAFAKLQERGQLPVLEACRRYEPRSAAPCSRACTTTLQELLLGEYTFTSLDSIVEMQRHIRQHGSIVCRMQLYSDIKPFFAANPGAVYKGPGGCIGHNLRVGEGEGGWLEANKDTGGGGAPGRAC
jgi:hypothetical protein